jgi:hypothetical protein
MDGGMKVEDYEVTSGSALIDAACDLGDSWSSPARDFCSESAPAGVRESFAEGDFAAGWKAWKRHLLNRRRPLAVARLVSAPETMLDWGREAVRKSARHARLSMLLGSQPTKRASDRKCLAAAAREWFESLGFGGDSRGLTRSAHLVLSNGHSSIANHSNGARSVSTAESQVAVLFESLNWLHLLARRVDLFDGELWWRVWRELKQTTLLSAPAIECDPLAHQLAAGELLLTLAYLFPELAGGEELRRSAAAALSQGMAELLDGEGLPQGGHIDELPALIACWTRCRLLAEHLDGNFWTAEAERQFPLALRELVRLSRPDGSAVFERDADLSQMNGERITRTGDLHRGHECLAIAAGLVADKPTRRLMRAAVRGSHKKIGRQTEPPRFPPPAVHSEWSEIAVLRPDWSPRAERLTVAYGDRAARLELAIGADLLLSGRWDLELRADRAPIEPDGTWRETCWVSDQDCDYLELEMAFTGGVRVQRQMLLARKDQFLFLADALLGERPQELSYCGRLPLSNRLTTSAAADTREVLLEARNARALILPVALPEWRADPRGGTLEIVSGALQLRQAVFGCRLFAPLWIDLSPRRANEAFTWRQLTIAEQRQNQPRDVAAGYRVQFGRRQWLIYRSLTPPANRTLLGTNLSSEFFLGRFKRDGETKTILEVE